MGGADRSEVNCVRRESSSAVTGARGSAMRTSAGRVDSESLRSAHVGSTRSFCARAECAGTLVCAHVSLGCAARRPESAALSCAFAEDSAAMEWARACIRTSIASRGSSNCN
eukprot:3712761-Pleurochrysis_carterae.AAC.2